MKKYIKISVVALSGILLIGGIFASGSSFVYADNRIESYNKLNELASFFNIDIIDNDYKLSQDKLQHVSELLKCYGLQYIRQIKKISYEEFIKSKGKLNQVIYSVDFGISKVLIGVGGYDS